MKQRKRRLRALALGAGIAASLAVLALVVIWNRTHIYPIEGRTVILDPGHFETPDDTGALNFVAGVTLTERDVNWEVSLLTKRILEQQEIIVVLTRQDGEYIDRPARYRLADASGGEVLLSIHHNGADDPRINYTTSFYTHQADISIARRAQSRLVEALAFDDGDIRVETFGMTAYTSMPAALTEAWFITHDATAARYVAEHASRTSSETGLGWASDSLVVLEAHALASALIDWLESHPPP